MTRTASPRPGVEAGLSRVCEHSNRQCLGKPSVSLGRWSKAEKVVLALSHGVYCGPYRGDVASYGVPVVGGDGEHSDALAKQVLLEPDALAAGYERVMAVFDGVHDRGPIPRELRNSLFAVRPVGSWPVSPRLVLGMAVTPSHVKGL